MHSLEHLQDLIPTLAGVKSSIWMEGYFLMHFYRSHIFPYWSLLSNTVQLYLMIITFDILTVATSNHLNIVR